MQEKAMYDTDMELDNLISEVSDLLRDIEKIKCDVLELKQYLLDREGCYGSFVVVR